MLTNEAFDPKEAAEKAAARIGVDLSLVDDFDEDDETEYAVAPGDAVWYEVKWHGVEAVDPDDPVAGSNPTRDDYEDEEEAETWNASSSKRAVATSISASASHRFRSSHTSEWYLPAPRATARSLSEKSIPHTRLSSPASTPALLRLSACKPSAHPTSKTRAPRFGRRTAPARIARTNASVASSGQRYPHSRTVRL